MPQPALRLLGPPVWTSADGTSHPLPAERLTQLLALLAVAGGEWVPRDRVLGLLWPDLPAAAARRNLRKLIFRARQAVTSPAIEIQADALRWPVATDLRAFDDAIAAGRWNEAAAASPGRLLDGLEHVANGPFGEWLHFERSRIDAARRRAFTAALAACEGDAESRVALARRWRETDRQDEDALVTLHAALRELGRADEAERERRHYLDELQAALALPGSARVLALPQGTQAPRAAPPPASVGDLVGRRAELQRLRATLADPGCRLLSVVGPGGVGKSRLLRAATADALSRGEPWLAVSLEDLASAEALPPRLAAAAAVALPGRDDALSELVSALAPRVLVLVLDNAEHLSGLREQCRLLLDGCPGVRLLVGSRTRLAIDGEWLLPLDGLPVPDADETDPTAIAACDGVRLFLRRAQAAAPDTAPERSLAEVAALVRDVEGLPLAIELAAAQVRLWPVAEIRSALARSIDLLARADGSGRRDSVRASLAHSWRLLTPLQQRVLAGLSVFPGRFGADAAAAVAGATPALLASLVDASMLRADGEGRFSLHALLRQDAAERLGDARAAPARLHAEFHARRMARLGAPGAGTQGDIHAEIEASFEDLRAAWQQAVAMRAATLLQAMTRPLLRFFEARARWREGRQWLGDAAAALESLPGPRPRGVREALATLWTAIGTLAYRAGELDLADTIERRALGQWQRLGDARGVSSTLNLIGLVAWRHGRHAVALARFRRALAVVEGSDDPALLARAAGSVALAEKALGRYDEAEVHYQRSLALVRQRGEWMGLASTLNNLGNLLRAQRRWTEALPYFEEAAALSDRHRLLATRPFALVNLGLTALELGDLDLAESRLREAEGALAEHGEPYLAGNAASALARIALRRGDAAGCAAQLERALQIGQRLADEPLQLSALACAALWLAERGQGVRAAALLHFVGRHRGAEAGTHADAREFEQGLRLTAAERRAARAQARAMRLGDELAALLRECAPSCGNAEATPAPLR